jgi:RHS repeat-associated protein
VVGTIAPDPDGTGPIAYAAVRNTYDAQGRLTRVESGELASWQSEAVAPSAWTGFTVFRTVDYSYDADSRKTKETLTADGAVQSTTQTSYDPLDRPVCVAVRMDPTVWSSQSDACVPQTTGANGPDRITRTLYTPQGWVDRIQKAFGTGLQQDYATYTYMATGQVASVTDANQNLATYGYDALYRLTQWNFPSPTQPGTTNPTDYEAYTYDNNGNRLTKRNRRGYTFSYSYDALNRMTTKVVPDDASWLGTDRTRDVYYGYDNRGLMTFARFDGTSGPGINNGFDNAGRMTSMTNTLIGSGKTLSYLYDADNNRTRITHPDGVSYDTTFDGLDRSTAVWWTGGAYTSQGTLAYTNRPASSTVYTYDGSLRLTHVGQHFASNANNLEQGFGYNNASQLTSETRDNDAFAFGGEYSVNRAYAVNGLNQYTAAGPDTLAYDANGNLTNDAVNGGNTAYVYDMENRLVYATGPTAMSLWYDPLGRLWATGTSSGVNYFLYDGDNLAAEYANDGSTMTKRYVFGTGTDEPLVEDTGATLDCSSAKFLHADNQGSIIAQVDCSGNITAHNTYDEYGINGSANTGRFQYTGQMWMPEIGLYYYKARMYSPTLGRFMQTDPIGYKDNINLYLYVRDDPTDLNDSTGEGALGWIVKLTEEGVRLVKPLFSKAEAVAARRREENILVQRRQTAGEIERASAGTDQKVMRHPGHDLGDGDKGYPHFQTDGAKGHSFYGALSAIGVTILTAADDLDKATDPFDESGLVPDTCPPGGCSTNPNPPMANERAPSAGDRSKDKSSTEEKVTCENHPTNDCTRIRRGREE